MSSPEAVQEYAAMHENDIESVVAKLQAKEINPAEITRVMRLLSQEGTAKVRGDSFVIFRDLANNFEVRFDDDRTQAA